MIEYDTPAMIDYVLNATKKGEVRTAKIINQDHDFWQSLSDQIFKNSTILSTISNYLEVIHRIFFQPLLNDFRLILQDVAIDQEPITHGR